MIKILVLCCISFCSALVLRTQSSFSEEALPLRIGVIDFSSLNRNEISFARTTSETWQNRTETIYEVELGLIGNPPVRIKGDPNAVIKNYGGNVFKPQAGFLEEILKELPAETHSKLKACGVSAHSTRYGYELVKTADVWIVFNFETTQGFALKSFLPHRSLIIGNGYSEDHLDKDNVDAGGKSVHNLWLPFGLWFWMDSHHSPLELLNRDYAKTGLSKKTDDLTVVYQCSKCYSKATLDTFEMCLSSSAPADFVKCGKPIMREELWDQTCEGMNAIGKKCYNTGRCNGNKKLGLSPPFKSAGGRDDSVDGTYTMSDGAITNYENFYFAQTAEHSRNKHGYVSEKIFHPILAGSIPIYAGDKHALDELGLNPESYVYLAEEDGGMGAVREVQYLLQNKTAYEQKIMQPVILSEEKFKKYFTLHSSTWPTHGDTTRQRILSKVLDLCDKPATTHPEKIPVKGQTPKKL